MTTDDPPSVGDSAWRRIAELLRSVSALPAFELEGLLELLAGGLQDLTASDECTLLVAIREAPREGDPLDGWRVREARVPHGEEAHRAAVASFAANELYRFDPHSIAVTRGAGRVRATLRHEAVTREEWAGSPSERHLAGLGVTDHLVGARPVSDDTEVYAVLTRFEGAPDFGPRERDHLRTALDHLGAPARKISLSFGVPRRRLLSPRERETLSWLLRGLSEKAISAQMGLSARTVHEYVVGVYRKLGVSSRAELMARWLDA